MLYSNQPSHDVGEYLLYQEASIQAITVHPVSNVPGLRAGMPMSYALNIMISRAVAENPSIIT